MANATILVADDDAAIRTVLNQALSRAGYEVRITSNAATLWRWISAGDGIHCYTPAGERLGRILVPETVANLTFGGALLQKQGLVTGRYAAGARTGLMVIQAR